MGNRLFTTPIGVITRAFLDRPHGRGGRDPLGPPIGPRGSSRLQGGIRYAPAKFVAAARSPRLQRKREHKRFYYTNLRIKISNGRLAAGVRVPQIAGIGSFSRLAEGVQVL